MVGETPEKRRFAPRRMEVAKLVEVLVREHGVMREGIEKAKAAAAARDFEGVRRALEEVDPVFRQHVADEESQILRLLIGELGAKGAESEIAVFRQHRPIYNLMNRIRELAAESPAQLEGNQSELDKLFEEHTKSEESRVFPKAVSLGKGAVERKESV
jgi:hemerythrin